MALVSMVSVMVVVVALPVGESWGKRYVTGHMPRRPPLYIRIIVPVYFHSFRFVCSEWLGGDCVWFCVSTGLFTGCGYLGCLGGWLTGRCFFMEHDCRLLDLLGNNNHFLFVGGCAGQDVLRRYPGCFLAGFNSAFCGQAPNGARQALETVHVLAGRCTSSCPPPRFTTL